MEDREKDKQGDSNREPRADQKPDTPAYNKKIAAKVQARRAKTKSKK